MANRHIQICGMLIGLLGILMVPPAAAETYRISDVPPESFQTIESIVTETIPDYLLGTAQCGGWDQERGGRGVGMTPGEGSVISQVEGVPGRDGLPLEMPGKPWASGMARRIESGGEKNDGFQFPDTATGRATACDPKGGAVERWVWHDIGDREAGEYEREEKDIPSFDDPPCTEPGNDDDEEAPSCAGFCHWLNTFTYDDCKIFCRLPDDKGFRCVERAAKFTCSEQWATAPFTASVTGDCFPISSNSSSSSSEEGGEEESDGDGGGDESGNEDGEEEEALRMSRRSFLTAQLLDDKPGEEDEDGDGDTDEDERTETVMKNCTLCTGAECRCSGGEPWCLTLPSFDGERDPVPAPPRGEKIFPSFYRRYTAKTKRDAVAGSVKPGDDRLAEVEAPVACYGIYREFDPKAGAIVESDIRCVIDFPLTHAELRESQNVVGQYKPDPALEDPPPLTPLFDDDDAWRPLAGGMSFPNEELLRENNGDLTQHFLDPDRKTVEAIQQRTADDPYALDPFPRATDDTVTTESLDARMMTYWIHVLEGQMARLLTPSTVRLRVPASWVQRTDSASSSSSPGSVDTGSINDAAVDIQLHAGDDIPAEVLALVRRYFVPRKETVYAVVPMGSTREFAARKAQWESYKARREQLELSVPAEVDDIITRFGEYERQIDRYRALRAGLANAAAALLGQHADDTSALVDWVRENALRYRAYLEGVAQRRLLTPFIMAAQTEITEFSDDANLPWCHVDLLTTPVYSFLRGWYPGKAGVLPEISCSTDEGTLPIPCVPDESDMVFDLTTFSLKTAPIRIPVVQPVQVQLDLDRFLPPSSAGALPDFKALGTLPALPPVPSLDAGILDQLVRMHVTGSPKPIEIPPPIDLEQPWNALLRATEILSARNDAYRTFWGSLEPSQDGGDPLACPVQSEGRCVHTEMDLRERMQRATAEPLLIGEQLMIQGFHRGYAGTGPHVLDPQRSTPGTPEDDLVAPPVHHEAQPTPTGWQIVPPEEDGASTDALFDELRVQMRRETIDDEGKPVKNADGIPVPYRLTPMELYRSFPVLLPIPLVAPPPPATP